MSSANQALFLNAIPLLALTALYAFATVALASFFRRERVRLSNVEIALALVFPCGAVTAAVLAGIVLADGEPLGGSGWLTLLPILVALVPGAVFLASWRDRAIAFAGSRLALEDREHTSARERRREVLNTFTTALARAEGIDEIARLVLDETLALVDVDFAGLALIEGMQARGVLGRRRDGTEVPLYSRVRFNLESEPSAVASAVFEAAPIVIYDMTTSPIVQRAVADEIGAQSGAFVPLVSRQQVIAVMAVVSTERKRTFSADELALLGELAAESALVLDRARSTSALVGALEREQLVASIARRIRSELDPDAVLSAAVEEVGTALGCSRCLVRLGEPGEPGAILAEWGAPGVDPVGELGPELPALDAAVRERRTTVIADVEAAPELRGPGAGTRDTLLALGARAAVVAPIVVFDAGMGALALHDAEPRAWSADDVALAEAVAHELGIVIHTARLLRENERRIDQDAALLKAAQAVTSELEPRAVLQRLVDEVAQLLGGDAADCYLLDRDRSLLRCAAVRGLTEELVGYEFPADRGLSGEALVRGRPVIAQEYERVAEPVPNDAYSDFAHAIVAPIVGSGQPLGVLGVGSRAEGRRFDEADADVLEAFASLASLALRNAQAFDERSRQARIQRGFYRIASVLGESLSLAGTLDAVAQAASEALGGSFAAVLTRRGARLELAGAQGLPAPLARALEEGLPASEAALHAAAAGGRTLAAPAVADDERLEALGKELAGRAGYRSLLAIPLHRAEEHDEGGLVLVFFPEERRFTDDDLELSRQLGSAVRGALERSSRFEEERRARTFAQQLARTGSLLATELDPAAVLDEVVQQAPALLEVEACAIRELEDEELVVTAAGGEGAEAALGERSPATGWLSGDVVQSRAPLAIEDAAGDDRLRSADTLLARGYRSFLGVPLAGPEGSTQGVLAVYARRPKAWRDEEIAALLALAGNASAALANAELYQRVALAKEQADAILSNIADGIVAVDREGKAVLWNNAAEQITGVPVAEALGRTPLQVLGRNLEALGDERGNRLVPILRGGDEVWLSLTEAIMRDPAGAVAGRIYAFRDISSDRMVEQMKSDFVSTVSQELRRPLTSIYGFAETLLRRDVAFGEEERRIFLGYIASESERLTEIVDRLLSVARLDTGDLQVNVVPIDVGSVVSEVVSGAEQTVDADHRFVLEVPEEPLHAEADPERLRQVVAHLIENAVKFSPEGGTVTVAARQRNGAVEVSVTDEGVGIPPSERQRIFRKFYRGEGAGRGQLAGTGLGLFIVQGLVQAMGGTISVDSTEGGGSSFAIALPLAGKVAPQLVTEADAPRVEPAA